MQNEEQSGNTISNTTEKNKPEMNGYFDETGLLYFNVREIYDSEYEEDLNNYCFVVYSYAGDEIRLSLKESQIREMSLYVSKEKANQTYVKHIMNND
jgi:hypothetical protein